MKNCILFLVFILLGLPLFCQRVISDCTVVYDLSVSDPKADSNIIRSLAGATKTIFVKGSKLRTDLQSLSFLQTTYKDSKSDTTIILREVGNAKYMNYLNGEKVEEQNKKYDNITFDQTGETKTILGYECKKAQARLKDGSSYYVYYTTAIMPSNRDYEYQFRNLAGFAMEYETQSENGKSTIKYSAVKITIMPVQNSRFDIPKSGYRIL